MRWIAEWKKWARCYPRPSLGRKRPGRAALHRCGTSPTRLGATPSPRSRRSRSSGCLGRRCARGGAIYIGRPLSPLGPVVGKPAHRTLKASGREVSTRGDSVQSATCVEHKGRHTRSRKDARLSKCICDGEQLSAEACHGDAIWGYFTAVVNGELTAICCRWGADRLPRYERGNETTNTGTA